MILVKVYGAFYPADPSCHEAVALSGKNVVPNGEPWLFFEGDMVRFAFEGLYFPLDEVLAALRSALPEHAAGKLDYLDLEAWTITRHVLVPGRSFTVATRGLNDVLDHSGH